ncbi:HCCA isomerase/glutathione S-transferase kappa [Lasiosphaeris hirsuta]|uniref:Glutathione S-transferase kappa n=1 Tax=Lasiosphaeris hirsuta TaxID=260670 RepID=A0AA39ZWZ7_9PEZI|nr:HCCA isomerase/glutathione S-transferase kappa [Lasiosphaeris hirsuta]
MATPITATATARPKITLYVDTVSPFAYTAYHILRRDTAFKDCDITYVPVFLGGLMHKCGNVAPIKIKNKDKWIGRERLRWAKVFNVPMSTELPPDFPAMTLPIGRVLGALTLADQGDQTRLIQALDVLYAKYWVECVPTHHPEVLREVLGEVFGAAEAESLLASAATAGKQLLIENTDRAFEEGAFGLPWMTCTSASGQKEGFWGVDHFGQMAQFLGLDLGKSALDQGLAGWKSVL